MCCLSKMSSYFAHKMSLQFHVCSNFFFVVLILLTRCHCISCIPLYVHLFVMYHSNRIIYKSNSLSSPIYLKIGWVLKMICDFEKNTKVICVVKQLHVSKKWYAATKKWYATIKKWYATIKKWYTTIKKWYVTIKKWYASCILHKMICRLHDSKSDMRTA